MRPTTKVFSLLLLAVFLTLASVCDAQCTDYTIGTECAKHCPAPGVVLEDGVTCFCDPMKYIVNKDTKTCERRLPLGYFPKLSTTADKNQHVLAEKCDAKCRTCQISEDFTTGDKDYCTSCDLDNLPILDLGAAKPTCVADLPAKRAIVIVQNNKLIGVTNQATQYGGSDSTGKRTDQSKADPTLGRESNTAANTGTSQLPKDTAVTATQVPKDLKKDMGHEAGLPKVMDLINEKGILGIGKEKDQEEKCTSAVGDTKEPRNVHPGIIYIAIACPTDCDECAVSKYGSLACTKAATGKFVQEGKVVADCAADGFYKDTTGGRCHKCPGGPGCKTCTLATAGDLSTIKCDACHTNLGYVLGTDTTGKPTCNQTKCLTEDNKYWDSTTSACVECTAGCALCQDKVCMDCGEGKVMKIAVNGDRTCVVTATGCGAGFFANEQRICQACHADCATCTGKGPNDCLSCTDAAKVLRPMLKITLRKTNEEALVAQVKDKTKEAITYQIDEAKQWPGACAADCNVAGFALYAKNKVCTPCDPIGCSKCDASGVCSACDKKATLSLITDPADSTKKICAECTLKTKGCRLCKDDDNTQCKMCDKGYSLEKDAANKDVCVKRCKTGFYAKETALTATDFDVTTTYLKHNVCTACAATCSECIPPDGAKCLLCKAAGQLAKPDGTCSATCDAGTYAQDGRCLKCGPNITACELDATTKAFKVTTCANTFFVHPQGTSCVAADQCGKGYYADATAKKCMPCDQSVCTECSATGKDKCTKCTDTSKFASSDGSCKATAAEVTCASTHYKDTTGLCIPCHKACDATGGCTGGSESNCKKCAVGFKVISTNTATTATYKCVDRCQPLSEEKEVSGQKVCIHCPSEATNKVFDFSTKTCKDTSAACPAGTVKTTLDKLKALDANKYGNLFTGDATTVSVCAVCDKKCATCHANDPSMCLTCATTLVSTAATKTEGSATINYALCTKDCGPGKLPDASTKACTVNCPADCAKCTSNTECERCNNGFFLKTDKTCVSACPDAFFANKLTGKCDACVAPCKNCEGTATTCKTCDTGKKFSAELKKCFTTCPLGTYTDTDTCKPCKTNILNCDAATGNAPPAGAIACDASCSNCIWQSTFCLKCPATLKMAGHGRCVEKCPENSVEETTGGVTTCKECSPGCLKCVDEANQGSTCTGSSGTKVQKCLKCDKDLGFYLLRDKCVRECPKGTYPDKLTGWCAQCDCNCGSGGCIDRFTCIDCPLAGMALDKETGRCKCTVASTAKWADDWKSFKITVTSLNLRYRDLTAEAANLAVNKQKTCRIGNEGSKFDSASEVVKKEDVTINRCGDSSTTNTELEALRQELTNVKYDSQSMADKVPNAVSTNPSPAGTTQAQGPSVQGQPQTQPTTTASTTTTTSTTPNTISSTGSNVKVITDTTGQCPAKKEQMNKDDLNSVGINSIETDFYKHIGQLGKPFGDISDNDILNYRSPLEGLKFVDAPIDLCSILFDKNTLETVLDKPTCSISFTATETVFEIKVGEKAKVQAGFAVKVQPNVFVNGCDWPILDVVKVTDATNPPATLKVKFSETKDTVVTCDELSLKVNTEGSVGSLECEMEFESALDASGNALTTTDVTSTKTDIQSKNTASTGEMKITGDQLTKLKSSNAAKIRVKSKCKDTYGQEQVISKDITLSSGETDIKMKNAMTAVQYDSAQDTPVAFNFDYTNCGSATAKVTYTTKLQKLDGANWVDTTAATEKMSNNVIPKGLASTSKYRVKVTATSTSGKSQEFELDVTPLAKKPEIEVKGIKTYMKTDEKLTHKFDTTNTANLANISDLEVRFTCTKCTGGTCQNQSNADIDMNTFYTKSTQTFEIPAGTLKENECYNVALTAIAKGETNTKTVQIKTADSTVTKALALDFNFKEGEFIDVTKPGHFNCRPQDTTVTRAEFRVNSISLLDSSSNRVTLACVTTSSNEIKYTSNCLSSGTTYTVSCEIENATSTTVKGFGTRSFTTQSLVALTATISPTSGNHLTKFAVTVASTYTEIVNCNLGVVDSATGGYSKIGNEFQISAAGSQTVTDIYLPPIAGSTSTKIKVECKAKASGAVGYATVETTVTQYTGADKTTQEKAVATTMIKSLDNFDTTLTSATAKSAAAKETVATMNSNPTALTSLTVAELRDTAKKFIKILKEIVVDTSDTGTVKTCVKGLDTFAQTTKSGGIDSEAISNFETAITSLFGSFETARKLQTTTQSAADTVKNMGPKKGSDSVVQLEKTDCLSLANTLSRVAEGVDSNKDQVTRTDYEKVKKISMVTLDKLFKSCITALGNEETIELPLKKFFVYAKKLSLESADLAKEHELAYDCPCGTAYKPTTVATDPDAISGKIDITGTKATMTANKRDSGAGITGAQKQEGKEGRGPRATAEGKCSVSIPALNKLSSSIKGCTAVMVTVVTSDSMCPNSFVSAEDSKKFKTDTADTGSFTTISTSNANDVYQKLNTGTSSCDSSAFANMQCAGPSLEVSFYCAKEQTVDTSNKLTVERLTIDKIEGGAIKYSMNCPNKDLTFAGDQTETPVFFNEYTGENSCSGCTQGTDGVVSCNHATSFGYSRSTKRVSNNKGDWWERIYADYILYLIIVIDLYFLAGLIFSLIKKDSTKESRVVNIASSPIPDETMKDNRIEQTVSFDKENPQSNNHSELHQAGCCKKLRIGFWLKYRLLAPFSTYHPSLSRFGRVMINVLVLYLIWVFAGIITLGVKKPAGSFCVSIVICFIVARLFIFCFELIHKFSKHIALKIITCIIAFVLLAVLHVSLFLIANAMESEFKYWGHVVLVTFFIDLIIWELSSLFAQLAIATRLARNPNSYSGNRKFMEKLITPPLYNEFMNIF